MGPKTRGNKTSGRKMGAIFPVTDVQDHTKAIETDLRNLKLEAEEAFCFGQHETTTDILERILEKEIELYGFGSRQVKDTNHELRGLMETTGPILQTTKGYEPGPNCAKILMANAILKTEGRNGDGGSRILKLLREAFENYWDKLGPEALPTLLAQRAFYMELATQKSADKFQLSIVAKIKLVRNLEAKLGSDYHLSSFSSSDLSNLLELPVEVMTSKLPDFSKADDIAGAHEMFDSGAPGLALKLLNSICNQAMIDDSVSEKKIWTALLLKAKAHYVLGEDTKCFANLHIVKELHRRFKAPEKDRSELEGQMRDLGYVDDWKLDLERVAEAQNLLSIAETKYLSNPSIVTRTKQRLAKILLETFHYDEAFRVLMQVYQEKAAILGPRHGEVKAVLDSICSPDLTRDFLSFPVLKELKTFFNKQCFILSRKLPKSDRTALKAQFFQAYLSAIVEDRVLDGLGKMKAVRDEYARQHGQNHGDVRFFDSRLTGKFDGWSKVEVLNYVMSLFPEEISAVHNRLDYLVRCSQLLNVIEVDSVEMLSSVYDILGQFYIKASNDLKPQDPVIITILKTAWIFMDKLRGRDSSGLKVASDRLNEVLGPLHPVAIKATVIYCTAEYTKFIRPPLIYNPDGVTVCEETFKNAVQVLGPEHEVTIKVEQVLGRALMTCPARKQQAKEHLLAATQKLKILVDPYLPHTLFFNHCKIVGHSFYMMNDISAAIEHVRLWKVGLEDKYGTHNEIKNAQSVLKGLQERQPGTFFVFNETPATTMVSNDRSDFAEYHRFRTAQEIRI